MQNFLRFDSILLEINNFLYFHKLIIKYFLDKLSNYAREHNLKITTNVRDVEANYLGNPPHINSNNDRRNTCER